jgi:hypothetical protein
MSAEPTSHQRRLGPVIRRYRSESAVLDELVEVLYRLLTDAPAEPPAELACLSAPHE